MNEHSFDQLEQQLAGRDAFHGAPPALRDAVLAATRRELAAARWDRRLGRVAATLLFAGVGLNLAIGLTADYGVRSSALASSDDSLVRSAVAIARATDAETGRRMAQQLAAWQGQPLSPQQRTAVDAALATATSGKDG